MLELATHDSVIILYDDDDTTFDYVIHTLIRICHHTQEQAEQCAIILHYTKKCVIKTGPYKRLKLFLSALLKAGLNVALY